MQAIVKHSKKRDAIMAVLQSTDSHPTAAWVHKKALEEFPDISLGTVYRNLVFFKNEGLAISVGVVNGEERFDAVVKPHPHFICEHCGRVFDLPPYEAQVYTEEEANGHWIDPGKTVFSGMCRHCGNRINTKQVTAGAVDK